MEAGGRLPVSGLLLMALEVIGPGPLICEGLFTQLCQPRDPSKRSSRPPIEITQAEGGGAKNRIHVCVGHRLGASRLLLVVLRVSLRQCLETTCNVRTAMSGRATESCANGQLPR